MTKKTTTPPTEQPDTSVTAAENTYTLNLSRDDMLALNRILENICKGTVTMYKWRTREQRKQSYELYAATAEALYGKR